MLEFDAETERVLDIAYQGADVSRRRQASFDALAAQPGETILDIGCGNGSLTAELARSVGQGGRVIGVDPSAIMRAAAATRCADLPSVRLIDGVAAAIPVEDEAADRAVSVQVFEYLDDIGAACSEAMRCVKPGGRLVISDLHFGSFIWFSDDPGRMERLKASWDAHFVSGDVPARLPALLRQAGHLVEDIVPVTIVDPVLRPDGVAIMMMHLMRRFAVGKGHVPVEEADAWRDEQRALAAAGRFFFSITQFVVVARKR